MATLDSVITFQRIAAVLREHPDKLLITGEDRFLGYSLLLGARAALIGMGSALPDLQADLFGARMVEDFASLYRLVRPVRPIQPDYLHRSHGGLHSPHALGGRSGGCPAARGLRRSVGTSPLPAGERAALSAWSAMRERLERDFERFKRELPRDFPNYVRDAYRIDLSARYLGHPLPHPIGKGSGNSAQPRAAGDRSDSRPRPRRSEDRDRGGSGWGAAMAVWAIHETRMRVERHRSQTGRRGVDRHLEGPGLGRLIGRLSRPGSFGRRPHPIGEMVAVPSVKYHLPRLDEPFRSAGVPPSPPRPSRQRGTTTPCRWRKISLSMRWRETPWPTSATRSCGGCARFPIKFVEAQTGPSALH